MWWSKWCTVLALMLLATMPSSSSYTLNNYGFGSGGTGSSASTTYKVNGLTGEQSKVQVNSNNFGGQTGNNYVQNAQVPTLTFTNSNNYYNELPVIVSTNGNPTDATYAIAISTDNFVTTNYVKSDGTVGSTLVYPTDYRTYSGWGSGSGVFVTGLANNTTYYVKAKAIQGNFTETAYGPVVSAATVAPQMSFQLTTDLTSTPPYSVSIGTLNPGSVVSSSPHKATFTYSTNAEIGSAVYISSLNAGLKSVNAHNNVIATYNGDLATQAEGYGAQVANVTQSSGGPVSGAAHFAVTGTNVGSLTTAFQQILSTTVAVTSGAGDIFMLGKAQYSTPAGNDYSDTITMVVAGEF